jgi:hypothetical protein
MKLSVNGRTAALFALAAACAAAVACADSPVERDVPELDDGGSDAADTSDAAPEPPSSTDAGDAGVDAPVIGDAGDAGPKSVCTVHGWCHTELPPEQTLRGVWGDGTGIVWTVSEQGDILRWDGTTWSIVHSGAGKLFSIWGSGPTDIWVGGANGLFHGSGATSATLSWTRFAVDSDMPILSLWGSSADDVWAVGNNGATSRVLHYGGPPAEPTASGWTVDPISTSVVAKLVRVWGYSSTDVWIVGSNRPGTADQPVIWHLAPDDAGVPTFTRDMSFTYYGSNTPFGGITSDPNNVFWYGNTRGNPYGIWGRRDDSSQPFTWTDAFNRVPQSHSTCRSQVHNGMLAFGPSDFWLYGDYGRLCHFDGTRWDLAAVSIEELPFTNVFWDAWAPNGDASQMWVVGKDVAIRKRATSRP